MSDLLKMRASLSRPRLAAVLALGLCLALPRAANVHADGGPLEMYVATVDRAGLEELIQGGHDLGEARPLPGGRFAVDLVLSPRRHARLAEAGVPLALWRAADGRTASQLAADQAEDGFKVWRSFDQPGGIRDELYELARTHPAIVKLAVIGRSVHDREIVALKVTKDAGATPDGARPAVLYNSMQHAREWISVEVNRRLLRHVLDGYGRDARITELVDTRELWFVLVANPDGYEQTFKPGFRLWRKTARDVNGDGEITGGDGIDPNRNFDNHWRYDEEGSDGLRESDVYRGPTPASEPETRAMQDLLLRLRFKFMLNYHSAANLLLWGAGWQVETATADDPIFMALSGTVDKPAIPTFVPERSAELYITNGETCDYAYEVAGTLCWTPELSGNGGGFVFPDDEAQVQEEFDRNLAFALDVATSATDPARPVSHLGNTVEPFYVDAFDVSYGDPQTVQVNAARRLGAVEMRYRVGDRPEVGVPTTEWAGGERYGEVRGVHYHRLRAQVTGTEAGDRVTVWFVAQDGTRSDPFTYSVVSDTDARVLVLAVEDRTGAAPEYARAGAPNYLRYYLDDLSALHIPTDVYDFDARDRRAPSFFGILSHYDVVIWYTGDDEAILARDGAAGTVSRVANELMLAVRDYLNEGGRLLYTGKYAGYPYGAGLAFDPAGQDGHCRPESGGDGCVPLSNDFLQYYLGIYAYYRGIPPEINVPNRAGAGGGWWSDAGDAIDHSIRRAFDLSAAAAPIVFALDAFWSIEPNYDYGYVEVSTDGGGTWETLPDMDGVLTDADPNDENLGWGLTGSSLTPRRLRFDLGAYAGRSIDLRLRYKTDVGTVLGGWWVDNLSLEAAGTALYGSDLSDGTAGWSNAGWRLVPYVVKPDVKIYPVEQIASPFSAGDWVWFGAPGAENQDQYGMFLPTSRALPVDQFPRFASHSAGRFDRPSDRAHGGEHYAHSGMVAGGYQRLARTIDLTGAAAGRLSFWLRRDMYSGWDAAFVEARTAGQDDWTTLADANGHTSPAAALNCGQGWWYGPHPHLAHYMAPREEGGDVVCDPKGTTGAWQAATGPSDGWEEWSIDLTPYAGKRVEVAVAYLSAPFGTRLGAFVDDATVTIGTAPTTATFEADLGDWAAAPAPAGSAPNPEPFARRSNAEYPIGAIAVTADTITLGFGLEGVRDADRRRDLMLHAMAYLLRREAVYLPVLGRGDGIGR